MSASEPTLLPFPNRHARQRKKAVLRQQARRWGWQLHLLRHWWLARHEPYEPFFVIASPRTGSNLLVEYLNQIPGVRCVSEILNHVAPIAPRRGASPATAIKHIRRWLQTVRTRHRGCKLFFNHLADFGLGLPDLEAAFPGARYVVLYRESLAEQFVSLEQARSTDQWLLRPGEERKLSSVTVGRAALRQFCDNTRRDYEHLLAQPAMYHRGCVFSYEELTDNPAGCMQEQVCSLLGVSSIQPQAPLRKQNPESLASRVANYASIAGLVASPLCQQRYSTPGQDRVKRLVA